MFRCACGGEMTPKPMTEYMRESMQTMHRALPFRIRFHRKRRIRKKWAKKFAREQGWKVWLAAVMATRHRGRIYGNYRCQTCGKQEGGVTSFARRLFPVEPMPEGAVSYYDREPVPCHSVDLTEAEKRAIIEKVAASLKT